MKKGKNAVTKRPPKTKHTQFSTYFFSCLPQVEQDPLDFGRLGKVKAGSESEDDDSEAEAKAVQANSVQKDWFSNLLSFQI